MTTNDLFQNRTTMDATATAFDAERPRLTRSPIGYWSEADAGDVLQEVGFDFTVP